MHARIMPPLLMSPFVRFCCSVLNQGKVTDDLMSRCDIELPNLDLSGTPQFYALKDPDNFAK